MSGAEGAAAPNLRERNKVRARAEIADAALRLFIERGFDAVTVEDIVTAAGISRRTFFRYFESKEDALLADYPQLTELLDDAVRCFDEGRVLAAMRGTVHRLADFYLDNRAEVLARSDVLREADAAAARNLRRLAEWEDAFAEAIAARLGVSSSDLLARASAILAVASFRAALAQWVRSEAKEDLHRLVDEAFNLVEHGLYPSFSEHEARG